MIYVGIDIAKTNHYASIVDYSTGEVIEAPFLVTNNKQGFDLLYSKIKNFDKEKVLIGLESTAHYGNNLIFCLCLFLFSLDLKCHDLILKKNDREKGWFG